MEETRAQEHQAGTRSAQDVLSTVLGDPSLLSRIASVIGGKEAEVHDEASGTSIPTAVMTEGKAQDPVTVSGVTVPLPEDGLAHVLSDPALMQKLPQIMGILAPLINESGHSAPPVYGEGGSQEPMRGRGKRSQRDDLLLALKPFLSPARCEAIDALIRISRLGSALQNLK